jgi:predicted small metal-binding protein
MTFQVNCTEQDSFMIQSEDEDEVLEHVKKHAQEKHDMELSDDDALGMIEET